MDLKELISRLSGQKPGEAVPTSTPETDRMERARADARLELAGILLAQGDAGAGPLLQQVRQHWLPGLPARSSNSVRIRQAWVAWLLQQGQLSQAQLALQDCAADARALTPHLALQQQALQAQLFSARADARAPDAWAALIEQARQLYGPASVWTVHWRQQAATAQQAAPG